MRSANTFPHCIRTIQVADAVLIFTLVLLLCLFGILTRPIGYLAQLWPANAVLLAVMVRFAHLSIPRNWLAAFLGYMAADLLTGSSLSASIALTVANYAGIVVGFILLTRLDPDIRLLRQGMSVVAILGVCAVAAGATAALGAKVSAILNGRDYVSAFAFWFSSEITNYLTIMPFILAIPSDIKAYVQGIWGTFGRSPWQQRTSLKFIALLLLLLACDLSMMVGGPVAIVFPLPMLLFVAMSFSLFTTNVIVLCYAIWCQFTMMMGAANTGIDLSTLQNTLSMRFGVSLLSLGPIAVASINVAREALVRALEAAANHDPLTSTMTRRAFSEQAQQIMETGSMPYCLLMLDIDHFKSINDRYGHSAGDKALATFAATIAANLRQQDLFGRLGGEEFAVLAPNVSRDAAGFVAGRLLRSVEDASVVLDDGTRLAITVSIGVSTGHTGPMTSLENALREADDALYCAKRMGRNRVEIAPEHPAG